MRRTPLHPSHCGHGRSRPNLDGTEKGETTLRILIALDDSPHSEPAVQFVTRVRRPAGSRVIVATVIRPATLGQGPAGHRLEA